MSPAPLSVHSYTESGCSRSVSSLSCSVEGPKRGIADLGGPLTDPENINKDFQK